MITEQVVGGTSSPRCGRTNDVFDSNGVLARQIPEAAYHAADEVFDQDLVIGHGDELHLALCAASPHIRLNEIDRLLSAVGGMASVAEVMRFLDGQRNALRLLMTD